MILLIFLTASVKAEESKFPIDHIPLEVFNKIWSEECTDSNESAIERYLNNRHLKLITPVPFFTMDAAIVSEQSLSKKHQCYRYNDLSRVVFKWHNGFPIMLSHKPSTSSFVSKFALFNFVSSSPRNDARIYNTWVYDPNDSHVNGEKMDLLLFQDNKQWNGIEITNDNYINGYFTLEYRNPYWIRKNIGSVAEGVFDYPNTNGLLYQIKDNELNILSLQHSQTKEIVKYSASKNGIITYELNQRKLVVKLPLHELKKQPITFIANKIGKNLQSLHGDYFDREWNAEHTHLQNQYWRSWINDSGYLTLENGKKQKLPNRQRLEVWLKRYLARQQVKLEAGKTYYFSKDLGNYLLMDYYKENGEPIYPRTKVDICKRFEVQIPDACQR